MPTRHGSTEPPAVLIVDDDAALRSLLTGVLEDYGFRTGTAEHGAQALDLLASGAFQVVVLDLDMPVMDGAECYRRMREQGAVVPTIILSAQVDGARVARDLGVPVIMPKPFDIDDLCRAVLSLSGQRSSAAEEPPAVHSPATQPHAQP